MSAYNNLNTLMHFDKNVWISKPFAQLGKMPFQLINICIELSQGEFAAIDCLKLYPDQILYKNENAIGTLDSDELRKYIGRISMPEASGEHVDLSAITDENEIQDAICRVYRETRSVKKTAKLVSLSENRVKKVLITHNLYESETYNKIVKLLNEGKRLEEIQHTLSMSADTLRSYLPYGYTEDME